MREVHLNNRLSRDFPSGKGARRRGGAAGRAAAAAGCLRPVPLPLSEGLHGGKEMRPHIQGERPQNVSAF